MTDICILAELRHNWMISYPTSRQGSAHCSGWFPVFYVEKSLTESGHGIFLREIATDMRAPIRHRRKRCVQVPLESGLREMQAILAKSWKSLISGMQKERWRQRILSAQTGYCMRRLSCVKQSVCRYFW